MVFKRVMLVVVLVMVCGFISSAEEVIQFGTDNGRLAKADETVGSQAKIIFDKDFMKMDGPNFWSCRWQFNGLAVDLTDAKAEDFLKIEVAGEVADEQPFIKIMFFSPDWSMNSAWIFDLSNIKKDEFSTVIAKTSLSEPAEKKNGGVAMTAIGNVMFFTGAKSGNKPWSIKIKSVSFGAVDAKK